MPKRRPQPPTSMFESRSFAISLGLHALLILVAAVGLPAILPDKPEPMPLVMTVEIVPIGAMTNLKPSDKPIQEAKKAKLPPIKKPVPPTAKEPPKPQPKPEPKAEEKPAPKEAEEKPFDPMEDAEPLPEKEKPKPKKEVKKQPPKKPEPKKPDAKADAKPAEDDFAKLLNQLKQEAKTDPSKEAKDTTSQEENKTRSDAPYDDSMPLSISETDMIRSQFIQCWRMPAGAKNPESLAARVHVTLNAEGAVMTAELTSDQMGRYRSDPFFRAAADSALRAVHKCSPLKNLPPDKYGAWRDMELNFDPQELM